MPTDRPDAGKLIPFVDPEAFTNPEKMLGAYFSSSTVGLCILDSDLRYLAINNRLAEINGIPAPDHLGKTVREVLGNFADVAEPELRRVFSTGEPFVDFAVSAMLPARGELVHWIAHSFPIKDGTGIIARIGVVVVEVAGQEKPEEPLQDIGGKLRKETDRLQMLLDVSAILAANWDMHQVFPRI